VTAVLVLVSIQPRNGTERRHDEPATSMVVVLSTVVDQASSAFTVCLVVATRTFPMTPISEGN
jgi:hypothetical protein